MHLCQSSTLRFLETAFNMHPMKKRKGENDWFDSIPRSDKEVSDQLQTMQGISPLTSLILGPTFPYFFIPPPVGLAYCPVGGCRNRVTTLIYTKEMH
eukprot:scaffold2784_cov109-Cylindrotheca_fusiformis.AAC.10